MGKPITIALRYDDFSELSADFLDKALVASLAAAGIPCTFAVVPMHSPDAKNPASKAIVELTRKKASQLDQAVRDGLVEVALHGCTHRSHRTGKFSEFAGSPAAAQREKIASGKAHLERIFGIPITTFVPPWNTYDRNTLKVLEKEGIRCISAFPNKPYLAGSTLRFVPATCLVRDLRKAVGHARRFAQGPTLVMAYFHPYEFKEDNPHRGLFTMEEFRRELGWLAAQDDVEVKTIGAIAADPAYSARTYASFARPLRMVPELLSRRYQNRWGVYPRHAGLGILSGL